MYWFLADYSWQQALPRYGAAVNFLTRPVLIPEVGGNRPGGREKCQGYVKDRRKVKRPDKT